MSLSWSWGLGRGGGRGGTGREKGGLTAFSLSKKRWKGSGRIIRACDRGSS